MVPDINRPHDLANSEILDDTYDFLVKISEQFGLEKVVYCEQCKYAKRCKLFKTDLYFCTKRVPKDFDTKEGVPEYQVYFSKDDYCSKGEKKEDSKE